MAQSTGRPVCLKDFEPLARKSLPEDVYQYYRSGAHPEQTLRDNEQAFQRYRLRPRLLRDVSNRDLRTTVLGHELAFPVAVAPTAMHRLAHSDGELATARAARSVGTGMALSAGTTSTMEDVAAASSPNGLLWAQCYFFNEMSIIREIVEKAEKYGYKALVVTIDGPVPTKPPWNLVTLPSHIRLEHFDVAKVCGLNSAVNSTATWSDIDWLHSITSLPIVLKGILTREDAREAMRHNVAGIVVSNHGARNFDGVLASVDALSEVVEAVRGSNIEVYMDGGVRTGTDVLKALALGARAVFIGRSVIWGLAYDGETGVRNVLEIIRDEFSVAMALAGCSSIADVTSSLVVRDLRYSATV